MNPSSLTASLCRATLPACRRFPTCQLRSISVRAVRAAARAQKQTQAEAAGTKNQHQKKQDPYRPRPATLVMNADTPMDVQRAAHMLHRAVADKNWSVAFANFRVLSTKKAENVILEADLAELLKNLGNRLLWREQLNIPSDADMALLESLFTQYRRVRKSVDSRIPSEIYDILIQAYARRQNITGMVKVWEMIFEDGATPALALYNRSIQLYSKEGALEPAERVFQALMQRKDIQPNIETFAALIKARAAGNDIAGAIALTEECLKTGERPHIRIFNSLMMAYRKAGNIKEMQHLLDQLDRNKISPNIITYNVLIDAYAKAGMADEAVALVLRMKEDSNSVPWRSHCAPDIFTYNTMLEMYGKANDLESAVLLYTEMKSNEINPDVVTFTTLMDAYRRRGDVRKVEECFAEMVSNGIKPAAAPYSVLINAYGGEGNVAKAREMYDRLRQEGINPNRNTYRALMRAHEVRGDPEGAVEWYWEMRRRHITPEATGVAIVLRAQVWLLANPTAMLEIVKSIYGDAEKCIQIRTDVSNQLLHAHLRAGMDVAEVVSTVYETEFVGRKISPDYKTLDILLLRGALPPQIVKENEPVHTDASRFAPMLEQLQHSKGDKTSSADTANASEPVTSATQENAGTEKTAAESPHAVQHPSAPSAMHATSLPSDMAATSIASALLSLADDLWSNKPLLPKLSREWLEARALMMVFRDVTRVQPTIPLRSVIRLAHAMDKLIGPVDWKRESQKAGTYSISVDANAPSSRRIRRT
ncbi:hypothetical protein DFJ77DRAFT_181360 [Powellomyces hirtus]|nr:hypothetical protein DFJ77DRAFT_181360 [Powellomyces hirtus]